jgi:hypothetical protein
MEYRVVGNENPIGSRRSFEDRINLHLRFGWTPQGPLAASAVNAKDWMKNAGVPRPQQSLFLFQGLTHPREEAASHLQEIGEQLKALQSREVGTLDTASKRMLKETALYLEEELEYHGDMFVDRELQESLSEVGLSRERLRKALKSLQAKKPSPFPQVQPMLPLQDAA